MKGGITSGIVYPAAVAEIAKEFIFKNVGGTSAGAIAAALTAAAERRRAHDGTTAGFERVAAVPRALGEGERLYRLFTPNAETRSLYRTVASLFGRPRFAPAVVARWCGLVWSYPLAALTGGTLGILSLAAVLREPRKDIVAVLAVPAAVATVGLGVTAAIAASLGNDLLRRLPRNSYGLVTGVDDVDRANPLALCTWLTAELEETAGLASGDVPLTFGMLWDAKRDVELPALDAKPAEPDVNLEMITTNVTWGRPYKFPSDIMFYYDPAELRAFFPDHVVDWMRERPRAPRDDRERARFAAYAADNKLPLPSPADLPVIVATRMSLAFPILLSAVPLYAADFSLAPAHDGVPRLERCWFSDGGISSNFPVTLFDSPVPRWPTFAINLAPFHPAHPQEDDESRNVYMPADNRGGRIPTFSRFTTLPQFVAAIFNAMQNWNDTTQARLPGYRDRIVTVFLSEDEGGLNLDMPPAILERLRLRGAAAGALIAGRFRDPSTLDPQMAGMGWETHRWARFRSTMGALRDYLALFASHLRSTVDPDKPYDDLIRAAQGAPTRNYPIPALQRPRVGDLAKRLAEVGDELEALMTLADDLPKPSPQLVLRGSLET